MSTLDEIFGDGNDRKKTKGKKRGAGEMSPYELLKDKTGDDLLLAALTDEKTTKSAGGGKLAADRARGIEFSEDGKTLLSYPYDLEDETYEIPEGVTEIGDGAFQLCDNLTEVHIPDSVTTIGQSAFSFCHSIVKVHIPDGVTSIGLCAFDYCSKLAEVHIPDSVTSIGASAFEGCESLEEVTIPRGCEIGYEAFPEDCRVKQRGDVKRAASAPPVREAGPRTDRQKLVADRARGIEFSDDGKTLLKYPDDLKDESYAVPEGVEVIGKNAFHEACFKNITFPGSLKRIEKEAFVWASEIREIILPEGLEEIGAAAFWCCPNLSGISIPRSVKEIGEYAFYGCSSLKKLVTSWDEPHGNVMTWRYHPFFGKSEEGEAPASLFSSPRVFHGCKNLLDVTGCDSVKSLVSEYQRRAANPLPEDDPECPRDYQFDDEW